MTELSASDKKLLDDIDKHGLHIIHVLGDEDGPGFSFSIGLYKTFQHPEIFIVGLDQEMTEVLINNIAYDIRNKTTYASGKKYSGILDNVQCAMIEVEKQHYREWFGYAKWYYKSDDFPVLQCVYPTVKGVFPWDADAPEGFEKRQPLLGNANPDLLV